MHKKLWFGVLATVMLGGCTSGHSVKLEANNSPQACQSEWVHQKMTPAEEHDYMQRCTAGYSDGSAKGDSITLDGLKKSGDKP